jgi:Protein of unknown function (DUF1444)
MFGLFKKKTSVLREGEAPVLVPAAVVPRLKHRDFIQAYRAQIERLPPNDKGYEGQMPVTRALAGDLIISYAIETPETFIFVSSDSMAEMGLDPDSMHARAMKNLRAQLEGRIKVGELENFKALTTPDGLEACSLLIPEFWDTLASQSKGELRVAVPGREYVCFIVEPPPGSADKAAADARRKVFKGAAINAWNASENHSLSQHVFAWKDRQWVPLERLEDGL